MEERILQGPEAVTPLGTLQKESLVKFRKKSVRTHKHARSLNWILEVFNWNILADLYATENVAFPGI